MREYVKVKDHKELLRDKQSKGIVSCDVDALNKYKMEREYKMKIARVVDEHEQMKQDVADIKNLLQTILGKL